MLDFNVGDKIRFKTNSAFHGFEEGDVGYIKELTIMPIFKDINNDYTIIIEFPYASRKLKITSNENVLNEYIEKYDDYKSYTYEEMNFVPLRLQEELKDRLKKTQTPIDTTTRLENMNNNELVDVFTKTIKEYTNKIKYDLPTYALETPFRKNYMSFARTTLFQENVNDVLKNIKNFDREEKKMVGLPYSVNFKKDRNRTTLVWCSVEVKFNYYLHLVSEEYYETTKSEAHNEKFNYLFGFLMAYFKRVHKETSKTQRKKYLNMVLYPMTQIQQIAFLKGVFYENCGLGYKEATSYLEKIEKGVEFEDGKKK